MPARPIGLFTAITLIVTNMVGMGAFTSLGYQLAGLDSPFAILMLWVLGGLIALCGAAVYGELGQVFPGSGGEYRFLSRLYHPMAGFLAGWISATVGFAAPIALSAMAFGQYAHRVLPWIHPATAACTCIGVLALVHAKGRRESSMVQHLLTVLSVALILFLIASGFTQAHAQALDWSPNRQVLGAPFAVSLVWVFYAYSGWNASTYLAGEIRNPRVNLPASLLLGTILVTVLYVALNLSFLRAAPLGELRGSLDVAAVAASHVFGRGGARLASLVICAVLAGSVSGMIFTGSRIPMAIAEEHRTLAFLRRRNAAGAPSGSVLLQAGIALVLVLSGTFQTVLTLVGFTLSLCTCLSVAGLFVVRARGLSTGASYRCWGYPVTPALFLVLNVWMLIFTFGQSPVASGVGLLLVASGIPVYLWLRSKDRLGRLPRHPEVAPSALPGYAGEA